MRCGERERGSVSAEFAVAMPAVILCLALCIGGVQAAAQQLHLIDAAAIAARALGRGDQVPAGAIPDGARQQIERQGGLICVQVTTQSDAAGLGRLGLRVAGRACALEEPDPTVGAPG